MPAPGNTDMLDAYSHIARLTFFLRQYEECVLSIQADIARGESSPMMLALLKQNQDRLDWYRFMVDHQTMMTSDTPVLV